MGILIGAWWSSRQPQCCDAWAYQDEATHLRHQFRLLYAGVHNYVYPLWLSNVQHVGLKSRLQVGLGQGALLLVAVIIGSVQVAGAFRRPVHAVFPWFAIPSLLPAFAYSGYFLTEALVAPASVLLLAGWLTLAPGNERQPRRSWLPVLQVSTFAGTLWMIRPALIWVPCVAAFLLALQFLMTPSWSLQTVIGAGLRGLVGVGTAAVIGVPQWFIAGSEGRSVRALAHSDLAATQATWASAFYRYATNLSGCGPGALPFSPFGGSSQELMRRTNGGPHVMQLGSMLAHWVSGWDALPGPSYLTTMKVLPWGLVTVLAGFVILQPVRLAAVVARRPRGLAKRELASAVGLLLFFLVSQATLIRTATEFRYNEIGWYFAAVCGLYSTKLAPWSMRSLAKWVAAAGGVSLLVIAVGELTMSLSDIWVRCVGG